MTMVRRRRAGFTLIELLVVVLIVTVIAALAVPAVMNTLGDRRLDEGARQVHAALTNARDRAVAAGLAGVRLEPDPGFPVPRLASGQIDPDAALVYSRIRPLADGGTYTEGSAAINLTLPETNRYPTGFTPPDGPLVLEESFWAKRFDSAGNPTKANPTNWWWNVRAGDRVEVGGAWYTVVGPLLWGADQNPELFVNWGEPGATSPLDRGDGPLEFLYLVNGRDDDRDGLTDEGADGLDNDLDGSTDEADEWELETWVGGIVPGDVAWDLSYLIRRRPVPAPASAGVVDLPAGIVVDATGWGTTPATDRPRSRLPVDPWTGTVEILVDSHGRVESRGFRSTPAAVPFGPPWLHFWVTETGSIRDAADAAATPGRLVSLHMSNGAVASGAADPTNPAESFRLIQSGGGR